MFFKPPDLVSKKKFKKVSRASVFVIAPGALWAYGLIDQ